MKTVRSPASVWSFRVRTDPVFGVLARLEHAYNGQKTKGSQRYGLVVEIFRVSGVLFPRPITMSFLIFSNVLPLLSEVQHASIVFYAYFQLQFQVEKRAVNIKLSP